VDESEQERYLAFLGERRGQILERMAASCERSGRDMGEVTLLAVSKTVDVAQAGGPLLSPRDGRRPL
jgi:hypothetical protein